MTADLLTGLAIPPRKTVPGASDTGSEMGAVMRCQLRPEAVRRSERGRLNMLDVQECPRPGRLIACALSCSPSCRGFEAYGHEDPPPRAGKRLYVKWSAGGRGGTDDIKTWKCRV